MFAEFITKGAWNIFGGEELNYPKKQKQENEIRSESPMSDISH